MGVNFNPSVSMKPVSRVDLKKTDNNERKNSIQQNEDLTETKVFVQKPENSTALVVLSPEMLTAAELITRANIIMAQEYGTPAEVADSMDVAELFLNKALRLESFVNSKAEKLMTLYEEGELGSLGVGVEREILAKEDGTEEMLEYAPNGDVIRKSTFKDGVLQRVEEFRPDDKKNILILQEGKPAEYFEGLEETDEGRTMERYFTFNDGEKSMYFENYGEFSDGSSNASRWIWFQDGKMCAYYEDMENSADGNSTIGLHLRYDDTGELYEYVRNIKNGIPQGRHLILEDGKWVNKKSR